MAVALLAARPTGEADCHAAVYPAPAIAVECCMETLHEDVTNFMKEMKEYREHCAKQPNAEGETRRPSAPHSGRT